MAVRDRVEGADGHPPGVRLAHQLRDPLGELARRLVGEGDRQQLVGARLARSDQMGDPTRQHERLAGARTGGYQERTGGCCDRSALVGVEPGEQRRMGLALVHWTSFVLWSASLVLGHGRARAAVRSASSAGLDQQACRPAGGDTVPRRRATTRSTSACAGPSSCSGTAGPRWWGCAAAWAEPCVMGGPEF